MLPEEMMDFLRSVYPPHLFDPPLPSSGIRTRPFVTLTYAQSLDGKIAGPGGAQIRLSGPESMALTHRLRELHDSILVGVGTVLSDDPQLNVRLPTLLPIASQPTPIILDPSLRSPSSAKLLLNYDGGIGQRPLFICQPHGDVNHVERIKVLQAGGAKVLASRMNNHGQLSLDAVLDLPGTGRSLMVEGGASVISSFLASGLINLVVITIAPVLVGDGICMVKDGLIPPELEHVATKSFGQDVVIVCRPKLVPTPHDIR